MQQTLDKLLRQYGNPMTLVTGDGEISVRAFLQETRSKSMENTQRQFLPLGEVKRGLFVYIGPAVPAAESGDRVIYQGRTFIMRRTEVILTAGTPVYCWGLCVEKGGDSTWGS